ncbi:MAG: tetratricopeptide repeat protein, partial [Acidobacteria bacterium]|nr:tetratricopeptide repeat protein [Acidobacteriota bacterium]
LQRATVEVPDNDHAHYMLAVANALRGEIEPALSHLRRAVELNPENRALARQDPELDGIRSDEGFRQAVDAEATASGVPRRRPRPRR